MDKRNPSYRVNSGPKMASPSYGPPSRQLTAIAETQTDIPTSQSTSKTSEDILEQSGVNCATPRARPTSSVLSGMKGPTVGSTESHSIFRDPMRCVKQNVINGYTISIIFNRL